MEEQMKLTGWVCPSCGYAETADTPPDKRDACAWCRMSKVPPQETPFVLALTWAARLIFSGLLALAVYFLVTP